MTFFTKKITFVFRRRVKLNLTFTKNDKKKGELDWRGGVQTKQKRQFNYDHKIITRHVCVWLFYKIEKSKLHAQCAKDCGHLHCVCEYGHALLLVFTQLNPYFNVCALIFSEFLHLKNRVYQWNMQNIIVSIFLIMKATILDTYNTSTTNCDLINLKFCHVQYLSNNF